MGKLLNAQRVVFLSHSAELAGAEILMLRLLSEPMFDDVKVLLFSHGELREKFAALGISASVIETKSLHDFRRNGSAFSALSKIRPMVATAKSLSSHLRSGDLLVASSQKAFVLGCLVKMFRKDVGPLIWWLHDILTKEHFSSTNLRTVVLLSKLFASKVICTSEEVRSAYEAAGGKRSKASVVEPGIDLRIFTAEHETSRKRTKTAISLSRISPWKGQRNFLDALALLPDANGLIVGAPLFGEQDYFEDLKKHASSLGLDDRVTFMGHRDDVAEVLRSATVFVHVPDAPEPFGQVVIEAMACGLPVVVSNEGAPGRICSGGGGILVPPNNPSRLAEAINKVMSKPDYRGELARKAKTISAKYDAASMRRNFLRALNEV